MTGKGNHRAGTVEHLFIAGRIDNPHMRVIHQSIDIGQFRHGAAYIDPAPRQKHLTLRFRQIRPQDR